jgi:hypothetical protein
MGGDIRFEVIKKIADTSFRYKDMGKISELDTNSPPSVFIGSKLKYPLMNVGILSPLEKDENAWVYDDAKYWAGHDFSIRDVVNLRNSLLNSRFQSRATDTRLNKKFVQIAQELAVASRPVDVEIELTKKVIPDNKKDKVLMPQGMRAPLKKARITSNVKIDRKLDKAMNDEIKADRRYDWKKAFGKYSGSYVVREL